MNILIENLSKNFQSKTVLSHINLEIQTGHLVALLGPSGSGKSTLLRIIAGFEQPNEGAIWLSGKKSTKIKIQDRQLGFVFQDYALFPHLTVFENIAFGMKIRKTPLPTIQYQVQQLLQLIQLENESEKYPYQLSGGQKQRVALARALAIEPKVLLLDEPFGALDIRIRKDLRIWLRKFHDEIPVTTIFVTHDQHEAMEIANEIVIFNNGSISQIGIPKELIEHPANNFVKNFLDLENLF